MQRHIKTATTEASITRRVGRGFRSRLALTTVLTVVPFLGYGRQAFAGCAPTGSSTYVCSGASGAQVIIADNAYVTTVTGFSVNTDSKSGIDISGNGQLTFIDTNASTITSTDAAGISVISAGNFSDGDDTINGGVTIRTNGNVTGVSYGIYAGNSGAGDISITADGAVTGEYSDGIRALNEGNDLTITTGAGSEIKGYGEGIAARNLGEGDLDITVNGGVMGWNGDGISAETGLYDREGAYGVNLTVTTGAQSVVDGGDDGIDAYNRGRGKLEVNANGVVNGYGGNGIEAENSNYGTALTITTGAESSIEGRENGIVAVNEGDGDLDIKAYGMVAGAYYNGIVADNDGTNLTITTGAGSVILGIGRAEESEPFIHTGYGIYARNFGSGNLDITANGQVVGFADDGIYAMNGYDGVNLTITTGAESVIIGAGGEGIEGGGDEIEDDGDGIDAGNFGRGKLEITANGVIAGGDSGIEADNSSEGTGLTITTGRGSVVWGGYDGINAEQDGDGNLTINVNGKVTGYDSDGIESDNDGYGETKITIGASGLVEGDDSAIDADSDDRQDISITNYGVVRNLSRSSRKLAIEASDGDTTIENFGDLIGTVRFEGIDNASDDRLDNAGFWNTAGGTNYFGSGEDEVINSGTLLAANDAAENEVTRLRDLEMFDNDGGLISLADGAIGDTLGLFGDGLSDVTYLAADGRLAVDAVLGRDGEADMLIIGGDVGEGGTTWVSVNVLDALGANTAGIPVVRVHGGSGEGDFQLDGPLNAGFYTWDMKYDFEEREYELYTSGVGVGAYEFAAGITAAQDMWFQSTGILLQRQADLRPLIAGMQVTPVADFAQPVEATPVAKVMPGFWMRGVGAWLERDDVEDGFTLDRQQTVFGGLAGFDFGTENVGSQGDALIFGLFGGYLVSDLDFKETNTEWSYEGPSVGVYASYLNGAFYADATVKADFLNISIDPQDLAPAADDSDTDGLNIGAMLDAGYKFAGGGGVFVEPQATLALLHTSIDDVDVFGGTVEFDDETSLRGRLGVRLGYDRTASNAVVYSSDVTASVWQNFSGENGATIVDPLLPVFGVSDDPARTYGDVSLGFSATAPEGWSGFLRGNYQFAADYEAIAGNAGVRYAW